MRESGIANHVEGIMCRTIARTKTEAMKVANETFPDFIAVGARLKDKGGKGRTAVENSRLVGSDDQYFYIVEMAKRFRRLG